MGRWWAAALALVLGLLVGWPATAQAGGGRLAPVRDRYETGDMATMVGYTGGPVDEPFYAYLRAAATGEEWYVGELVVEETGHRGYLHLRVSISFEVPADLEAGQYELSYCDDPCTGAPLADLVPSPVSIGVDAARRVVREWALDDPEISNLDGEALLVGPGFHTTAAQLRAVPAPEHPPAPKPQPEPAPAPAAPPPTAATPDDDMAWPLPTALVLAGAGATALFFGWRQRAVRPPAAAPAWAPSAGRG